MAVRQYVGARYVPKFYQNSENPTSSEWENGVAYEALTVVTYNNSSYTSKIPVPAGIGNPASNPTYWVVTGDYNAQMEQYRQEVVTTQENINTQIDEVNSSLTNTQNTLTVETNDRKATEWWGYGKKIAIYGDSTTQVDGSWANKLNGAEITNRGVGGTNLSQIYERMNSFTDNDDFDYIIVAGGINDWQSHYTATTITNYVCQILEYLTPLTNALFVSPLFSISELMNFSPMHEVNNAGLSVEYAIRAINMACEKYNVPCFNPYFTMGVSSDNITKYMDVSVVSGKNVYVHENDTLGTKIAKALMNWDFTTVIPEEAHGINLCGKLESLSFLAPQTNDEPIPAGFTTMPFVTQNGLNLRATTTNNYYNSSNLYYLIKGTRIKVQAFGYLKAYNAAIAEFTTSAGTAIKNTWMYTPQLDGSQLLTTFIVPESGYYSFYFNINGYTGVIKDAGFFCNTEPESFILVKYADTSIIGYIESSNDIKFPDVDIDLTGNTYAQYIAYYLTRGSKEHNIYGTCAVTGADGTLQIVECKLDDNELFINATSGTAHLGSIKINR